MLKLCGANDHNQLSKESNNKYLELGDPSSSKTAVITTDGIILAVGDNSGCKITGSLPSKDLTKFTKIEIKNGDIIQHPISAVCGLDYTVYIVSPSKTSGTRQLAYSYNGIKTASPLFLNIGNWKPVSLFGGDETAAAIDDEGAIIFIPDFESIDKSLLSQLSRIRLPDGEKAKCVACCKSFIIAVGSSGRVFE